MKKIGEQNGALNYSGAQYVCTVEEFERETDKPDGSTLQVLDESNYKVVNYCIAYNGHWIDR